jgi:hypothetical protein
LSTLRGAQAIHHLSGSSSHVLDGYALCLVLQRLAARMRQLVHGRVKSLPEDGDPG